MTINSRALDRQVGNHRRAAAGEDGQRRQEPLEHQAQAAPARRRPAPEGGDAPPAPHDTNMAAELLRRRLVGAREDAGEHASAPAPPPAGSPRQPGGGLHLVQLRNQQPRCAAVAEPVPVPVPVPVSISDGE
jgi:hypothetical protein